MAVLTRLDYAYEPLADGEHAVRRRSGLFGAQLRGAGVLYFPPS